MSQVFSGDAVNNVVSTTLVTTAETPCATSNFLSPPFGNAKALVFGSVNVATGVGANTIVVRLRRNPNAENLQLGIQINVTAAASAGYILPIMIADAIPDGRPVQYAVTIQQLGATGNGSVSFASVSAILISG